MVCSACSFGIFLLSLFSMLRCQVAPVVLLSMRPWMMFRYLVASCFSMPLFSRACWALGIRVWASSSSGIWVGPFWLFLGQIIFAFMPCCAAW